MRTRKKHVLTLLGAATILVVGLTVSACAPLWPGDPGTTGPSTTTTTPSPVNAYGGTGPKVAVVGDSITAQSKTYINDTLRAAGFSSSVTGLSGWTLYEAKPYFDQYVSTAPAVVIEEFGINDEVRTYTGTSDIYTVQNFILRVLALKATFNTSCFVPTTVTTHLTEAKHERTAEKNATAAAFNANIRTYYPIYVDWDALSFAHPEYLQSDEIHPNDLGRAALAAANLQAVQACMAAVTTTTAGG